MAGRLCLPRRVRLCTYFSATKSEHLLRNLFSSYLRNRDKAQSLSKYPSVSDSGTDLEKVCGEYSLLSNTAVFIDLSTPSVLLHPGVCSIVEIEDIFTKALTQLSTDSELSNTRMSDLEIKQLMEESKPLGRMLEHRRPITLAMVHTVVNELAGKLSRN